jgi:hypothetical protein
MHGPGLSVAEYAETRDRLHINLLIPIRHTCNSIVVSGDMLTISIQFSGAGCSRDFTMHCLVYPPINLYPHLWRDINISRATESIGDAMRSSRIPIGSISRRHACRRPGGTLSPPDGGVEVLHQAGTMLHEVEVQ